MSNRARRAAACRTSRQPAAVHGLYALAVPACAGALVTMTAIEDCATSSGYEVPVALATLATCVAGAVVFAVAASVSRAFRVAWRHALVGLAFCTVVPLLLVASVAGKLSSCPS